MSYILSQNSLAKLVGVDPRMVNVVKRAIVLTTQDFMVGEGVRTLQRQYELYAQGRTVAQLRAAGVPASVLAQPGKKQVTWTLKSNHFADPKTHLGNAVDLIAYPVDYADISKYRAIKDAMFAAAQEQGTQLRWGGDWNGNGVTEHGENDFGHFELHA